MNNKQLLIKVITLLFQETQQTSFSELSRGVATRVIESIKLPEITLGLDSDRNIVSNLIQTAKRLNDALPEGGISVTDLKQQFVIDAVDDTSLLKALETGLATDLETKERENYIRSLRRELDTHLRNETCKAIMKEYHTKAAYHGDEIENLTAHITEMIGALEPYVSAAEQDDPALVARAMFTDDDEDQSALDIFKKIKESETGSRGYRFGFQHINKMVNGHIDEGKLVTVSALNHHHKTGLTLAFFRQLLMYNIPRVKFLEDLGKTEDEIRAEEDAYVYDPADWVMYNDPYAMRPVPVIALKDPFYGKTPVKKPLAIRISAEDEITDNLQKLFEDTYFNIEGKVADTSSFSYEEMTAYTRKHLLRNGWHAQFERINPSEWTYRNIIQRVLDAEAQGYEVKIFMIDYLAMIPTKGCETGPAGVDLRDMFRRVRNFMSA